MEVLIISVIIICGAVGLALAGLYGVRHSVELSKLQDHHDVAGFFIGVVGVIYAVLLAFVVLSVWEDFRDASTIAETEASRLADLHWLAEGFADQDRARVQNAVVSYATVVVDVEWDMMGDGAHSQEADRAFRDLHAAYTMMEPSVGRSEYVYAESIARMSDLSDSRTQRLNVNREGLSPVIWIILIVGGALTIIFTYFFGVESIRAQSMMTAGLTIMIALTLVVILAINHPFRGDLSIQPDAMEEVIAEFH